MGFLGLFPSEEEKQASKAKSSTKKKKEAKETQWSDPNEDIKYVIHGGKIQCPYCSPPIAEIIVTSNTVMLQDKPIATIKDKDGKVNFNFMGVCNHPSQQKPSAPPPPCKAIINLGEWKDVSETMICNDNAILVKSKIPCMISGEYLEIIHSGQIAVLSEVEPKMKRTPQIIDVYWKEEGSDEKNYNVFPSYPVKLFIETEDYELGEKVSLKAKHSNKKRFKEGKEELEISVPVNNDGIAILENFVIEYE